MVMTWIYALFLGISLLFAALQDRGGSLAAAVTSGAQSGITLAISISGAICLWTGVGKLMEKLGLTAALSRLMKPVLRRLFPGTREDSTLAGFLSANICANLLGLGNAATPMGIQAARRMVDPRHPDRATAQLCRLVVLNTASIQLIPTNVAAVRAALGCGTPFDLLLPVWVTSLCSAGLGVTATWLLGRMWKD